MPIVNLKSIYNVSSEDTAFPAKNLLSKEVKKWKCKSIGETSISVVIELEKSTLISGIDIGNEHSAFIEVLVGKNGATNNDFKEILLTSSFMTPMESRNSKTINRVRCFAKQSLIESVANEKWNLVKILCTQPFNKHVQYGVSFIKIHTTTNNTEKDDRVKIASPVTSTLFGNFKVRSSSTDSHDESDDNHSTSLFQRWKQSKNLANRTSLSGAAAIRDASSPSALLKNHQEQQHNRVSLRKPSTISVDKNDSEDTNIKKNHFNRNRNTLFYEDDDDKPNEKFDQKIQKDLATSSSSPTKGDNTAPPANKHLINSTPIPSTCNQSNTKLRIFEHKTDYGNTSTTKKRPLSPLLSSQGPNYIKKLKSPDKKIKYKPFNKLFEDVIFTISGIQNPDRSNIRQRALEMGAKYKTDWDKTCTHLICAFKNTPKYNQVLGHGKIMKKEWILDCYMKKKRIPWRRYALESNDAKKIDSEEEILDILIKPSQPESKNQIKDDDDDIIIENMKEYILSSESEDTEDEIDKINNEVNDEDIYDQTTEDESNTTNSINNKLLEPFPEFFDNFKFYLNLDTGENLITPIITLYKGKLTTQLSEANYLITNDVTKAASKLKNINTFTGEIVKPNWIKECKDVMTLLPTTNYKFDIPK